MPARIPLDKDQIATFCRKWDIRELSFFGSVLRDDFGPGSDIDVLVAFRPQATVGLIKFFEVQEALAELLGRQVDLVPKEGLKPSIRESVLASAEVVFAA